MAFFSGFKWKNFITAQQGPTGSCFQLRDGSGIEKYFGFGSGIGYPLLPGDHVPKKAVGEMMPVLFATNMAVPDFVTIKIIKIVKT